MTASASSIAADILHDLASDYSLAGCLDDEQARTLAEGVQERDAEIAKLRALLAAPTDGCRTCEVDHRAVLIDELRAENERLRALVAELEASTVADIEAVCGAEGEAVRIGAEVDRLDHENTVLVEQWHEVAQSADMWSARAETALRPLGESVDAIVRPIRRGHEDRDRALDACAARIDILIRQRDAAVRECNRLWDLAVEWLEGPAELATGPEHDAASAILDCAKFVAKARDHYRAACDVQTDLVQELLLDCARLTEERNALLMGRATGQGLTDESSTEGA
jgi:hypothetical protein